MVREHKTTQEDQGDLVEEDGGPKEVFQQLLYRVLETPHQYHHHKVIPVDMDTLLLVVEGVVVLELLVEMQHHLQIHTIKMVDPEV
jgi:hypothetical protein